MGRWSAHGPLIVVYAEISQYINSYHAVQEPKNRWTNRRDTHELYQLGHLAEASCAYYILTGKQDLIEVVRGTLKLV